MAGEGLASQRFRRERHQDWRTLEELVKRAERRGLKSLHADELLRLPLLYRDCASSLSVARSISLDANLVAYLEALAGCAYFVVYGTRVRFGELLARFVWRQFPAAVCAAWLPILFSAALLLAGIGTGWMMTAGDSRWFDAFVSADLADGRTPAASRAELAESLFDSAPPAERLAAFASFLFQNNARIGMMCFALGALIGAPVVVLLIYNGLALGAMCAVFDGQGIALEFLAWLSVHGTTELLAVAICGGAGFHLASAMIDPGRRSRLAALAAHGRRAAALAVGAVGMLLLAALIEGFVRQLITDTAWRLGIGGFMLAAWVVYFAGFGRAGRGVSP